MRCARCHRSLFRTIVQVQEGTQLLAYGPRCAVVKGYRLAGGQGRARGRRRNDRQASLFEVRP